MADFLRHLPAPQTPVVGGGSLNPSLGSVAISDSINPFDRKLNLFSKIPPYGKRVRWVPKTLADFADGGAYPEIHVLQYPLDMGKKPTSHNKTVALQVGKDGKLQFDAVIKQRSSLTYNFTKPEDQKPDASRAPSGVSVKGDEASEDAVVARTKAALEEALNEALSKTRLQKFEKSEPEFFKYTPNQQAAGHNANCSQRIIRMVEKQKDPLEVSKFKHKKVPAAPPSPPAAVLHSPPRKVTQKDQQEWKIPPCVSNWKNQKGYTIPLDKRLQADGRGLHDVTVNDKFASLSESLYIAERSAREEIRIRNEMLKQKRAKEEEVREQQLKELAAKVRVERSNLMKQQDDSKEDAAERLKRLQLENERKRNIERDYRLEKAGKKGKISRDENRDISERIALGQAQPTSQETLFDARLFNQSSGLDTGYNAGHDDDYNIYDKPLFADRAAAGIYQYSKDRIQQSVGESMSLPSFSGAVSTNAERTAPVEFEKCLRNRARFFQRPDNQRLQLCVHEDMADPFGLDTLISEAKRK